MGPASMPIEKQSAQMESDLTGGSRWPVLAARVVAETPVREAIGKAIGIMMVSSDVSDGDAFDILRRTSQHTNVKLADIAADVIRGRSLQ